MNSLYITIYIHIYLSYLYPKDYISDITVNFFISQIDHKHKKIDSKSK